MELPFLFRFRVINVNRGVFRVDLQAGKGRSKFVDLFANTAQSQVICMALRVTFSLNMAIDLICYSLAYEILRKL
jgi:hypothetical protein